MAECFLLFESGRHLRLVATANSAAMPTWATTLPARNSNSSIGNTRRPKAVAGRRWAARAPSVRQPAAALTWLPTKRLITMKIHMLGAPTTRMPPGRGVMGGRGSMRVGVSEGDGYGRFLVDVWHRARGAAWEGTCWPQLFGVEAKVLIELVEHIQFCRGPPRFC